MITSSELCERHSIVGFVFKQYSQLTLHLLVGNKMIEKWFPSWQCTSALCRRRRAFPR